MSEPMRVAQIMGKMHGGGVEHKTMDFYRHIDRGRVQFDFLVDADSTLVPRDEIESLGGRVFEVPPYQRLLAYQRELTRLFCEQHWLIVHSHINALSVFPLRAAKRAGVPVRIAHSRSTAGKGEMVRNAAKIILKQFSNVYPTHRMACSRYAGEWLFGKGADFDVLYNAMDLAQFSFADQVRMHARASLNLADNQFAIGHVGRFMPQKNHKFLIEVFAEVTKRRKDAILFLVGSGKAKSLAENWAAERGIAEQVRFLGQRNDVNHLYQAFDAFVLPSLYEGFGNVAVEAQRAGLPCFLSDRITREVDVTGNVCFLPIDNPLAWADALCSVEPGQRFDVHEEDFTDFDIDREAERLAARYLEFARGTEKAQ